jgi:S1-C subfamily serine protease
LYADLVGADSVVDLALLHVPADGLEAAAFGDPNRLQQGDPLIVVGFALNLPGEPSITRGVFSGRRTNPESRVNYLQTDAAMNPGVSGGGVLDRTGAIVGINVAGIRSSNGVPVQGINFAIPADLAQSFVQSARSGQLVATASPTPIPPPVTTGPVLVVNKRFGAALRASPSSDAAIVASVGCGQPLEQLEERAGGWFRVSAGGLQGWVGGARVQPGSVAPAGACAGAPNPPYTIGEQVRAQVQSGCLSVRTTPSGNAQTTACVQSGYAFTLTNGPIEVSGEDWFGVRGIATNLSGWTRAAYLVR